MNRKQLMVYCTSFSLLALSWPARACTSILVSRGASKDGSVMITYSADGPGMPRPLIIKGGIWSDGAMVDVRTWEDDSIRGRVRQAKQTYSVVCLMNEHQVTMAESTWIETDKRRSEQLVDPGGRLTYSNLMLLTLQRARTAREAIKLVDELAREYGYASTGETFSIADKNEVWMMELIGKGPGSKGLVWVAARVPDGCITVHANLSRITTFPLDDPENYLYAPDVISFAVEKGYYHEGQGRPFSFRDAYSPGINAMHRRGSAGRVWSVYRRAAPSRSFSAGYFRGVPNTEDYELFIKPDVPLSLADTMALMRDHFEGTPYDMTKGLDAGPWGSPYRARPLVFTADGRRCMWERPISTQQAGFVMVTQSRAWLPDRIGGVTWYAVDDAYTSCFTPFYCGIDALPEAYTNGDYQKFSWDSAWSVMNLVSNLTYDRWSRIIPDVQAAQRRRESDLLAKQTAIEAEAAALNEKEPSRARRYLTDYCVSSGDGVFRLWQDLAKQILVKHMDYYQKDGSGTAQELGTTEEWKKAVEAQRSDQLRVEVPEGK